MTTLTKVRADLDRANAAVGAAQTLLRQGQAIDLGGLETHVEGLCADIGALPLDERVGLKASLVALIDDLNRLAEDIEANNAALSGEIKRTGDRHRAATAYAHTNAKDDDR